MKCVGNVVENEVFDSGVGGCGFKAQVQVIVKLKFSRLAGGSEKDFDNCCETSVTTL